MRRIKEFIVNIVSKIWGNALGFLVQHGEVAVRVTGIVKSIIENPALNFVVELTPTKADDRILAKAKQIVPAIGMKVAIAMNIVEKANEAENDLEAFSHVLEYISTKIPEEGRGVFYREFSGQLAAALSDGKISVGEGVALAQLVFNNYFKK